jgi:hypothetical protein
MSTSQSSVLSSDAQGDRRRATPDEDEAVVIARTMWRPEVGAAVTLAQYAKADGDLELQALVEALAEATRASNKGDLSLGEAMLTAHARVLDTIFNTLARRAGLNMGLHLDAMESYMKLALRAQNQCRVALEALAVIKNPPLVGYARQANIARYQQVNNAPAGDNETSHGQENPNLQNKLLERKDGERLDTGAAETASGLDSDLETVGAVHRPANARR